MIPNPNFLKKVQNKILMLLTDQQTQASITKNPLILQKYFKIKEIHNFITKIILITAQQNILYLR
jgi:hypothetical protein